MNMPKQLTFERKLENLQDIKTKLSASQMYLLDIIENYEQFLLKYKCKHFLDKIIKMIGMSRSAMERIDDKIEKFQKGHY
jgi:exonuclease VII small subunit